MMRKFGTTALLVLLNSGAALAQAPLDLDAVDPAMVADFLGDWTILNADASKSCKVTLSRKPTIGGMVINIDPDCGKVFPVMNDVASWRLLEDWEIVLADATKKSLVHFTTPDNPMSPNPKPMACRPS